MEKSMTRICFIIPYFGTLPNYFNYWLESVKCNSTIDFIIFTNDKTKYAYPKNVKVFYMEFEQLRGKIQKKFDFEISLDSPYKLCDFKPTYGYVFSEYLRDYDFWGHCDIDLIFGNIRSFFSEEIFEKYDKLLTYGHCELYRNTPEINQAFMNDNPPFVSYRVVLSSPAIWAFDESTSPINRSIWNRKRQYKANVFVDLWPRFKNLVDVKLKKNCVFVLEKGDLYEVYDSGERTVLYAHFKKRKIECKNGIGENIFLTPYGIGYTNASKRDCFRKEGCVSSLWKYNYFNHYKKIISNAFALLYFVLLKRYPRKHFLMWSRLSNEIIWKKYYARK